jgi:hypothetical protein
MTRVIAMLLVMLLSALAPAYAQAQAAQPVPVVAELFTSEGCNSCPPADRLLEMLSAQQPIDGVYVVALSEHLTYWDRLGWKDPFGSQRFTARQNMYAFHFKLDGPFTPQLVIDGVAQVIGNDAAAVRAAISQAAQTAKPELIVTFAVAADGTAVASASGPGLRPAGVENPEIVWAVTEDNLTVDVRRGENANRTLQHSGVVREFMTRRIDAVAATGLTHSIQLRREWNPQNLRMVVFVQSAKTKRVVSAGSARLRPGE